MTRLNPVQRGTPVSLYLNGEVITAYPGEMLATALLASGLDYFRLDRSGKPRGLLCNMGTCSECTVWVAKPRQSHQRVRACLTETLAGLDVRTHGVASDE